MVTVSIMRPDPKKTLFENVQELMLRRYGKENQTRFAADTKIRAGGIIRIKSQKANVGIDTLEMIAKEFDLEVWHLLLPGLHLPTSNEVQEPSSQYSIHPAWPFPRVSPEHYARLPAVDKARVEGYVESLVSQMDASQTGSAKNTKRT